MPGRVFLTTPIAQVAARLDVDPDPVRDEPARRNIAPGDQVVALTTAGLARFRWGIIPVGRVNARGRPVMETIINARSETLFEKSAFSGTGRAVLPVDGWYEWTGEKRRKTVWKITPSDARGLYFAAITDVWQAPGGQTVPQLATVTCAPNADLSKIHHRMAVILDGGDVRDWLLGDADVARSLMKPWPAGLLSLSEADPSAVT